MTVNFHAHNAGVDAENKATEKAMRDAKRKSR